MAGTFPFARVIGVEVSSELNEAAERIVKEVWDRMSASQVLFVRADAAALNLPDDATVLYFYNPFFGELLRKVMARVLRSLERKPRDMWIVTCVPATPVSARSTLRSGSRNRIRSSCSAKSGIRRTIPASRSESGARRTPVVHETTGTRRAGSRLRRG